MDLNKQIVEIILSIIAFLLTLIYLIEVISASIYWDESCFNVNNDMKANVITLLVVSLINLFVIIFIIIEIMRTIKDCRGYNYEMRTGCLFGFYLIAQVVSGAMGFPILINPHDIYECSPIICILHIINVVILLLTVVLPIVICVFVLFIKLIIKMCY